MRTVTGLDKSPPHPVIAVPKTQANISPAPLHQEGRIGPFKVSSRKENFCGRKPFSPNVSGKIETWCAHVY